MANARQLARQCAVQALYSWQLTDGDPFDIDAAFRIENDMDDVDVDYFRELLCEIPRLCEELDGHIIPLLARPLAEVDPVERAILRLGAYELK
ncbi:Transcription termination protein NusB, partial [hydrothermal vent metagenome]